MNKAYVAATCWWWFEFRGPRTYDRLINLATSLAASWELTPSDTVAIEREMTARYKAQYGDRYERDPDTEN